MNQSEEKALSEWFESYAGRFAGKDGQLPPMLKMKFDHSRRVSAVAAAIGIELGFSRDDERAVRMLGLLHDVARFSQYAVHSTLRDADSFDHGRRGAEIMADCPFLAACAEMDRRRILAGIRHHNQATLPEGLGRGELEFLKLTRDADKLDIFNVLYAAWKSGDLFRHPDIALMVSLDGPVTPAALDDIRQKRTVRSRNVKSLADLFLLQLSWVYDINFRPSYQRLASGLVIENIAEVLPNTLEIKHQLGVAQEHVAGRLGGKPMH